MWEQDEVADAAIERLQIMQAAEDETWGHLTAAQTRLAEGFSQAGAAYSGAAQMAASAYSAALSASGALAAASGVQGPSGIALALGITGQVAGTVGAVASANAKK